MPRIAVLTSGGDAPGMYAAIRAVVRSGIAKGFEVFGVHHGHAGLIAGEFVPLGARQVGGVIERGGTMLGTTRCAGFTTARGQDRALGQLREREIGGLVVGGNGSQTGAHALSMTRGLAVIGRSPTASTTASITSLSSTRSASLGEMFLELTPQGVRVPNGFPGQARPVRRRDCRGAHAADPPCGRDRRQNRRVGRVGPQVAVQAGAPAAVRDG